MTTSSRKKPGILPVRLGIEPDNKTALSELGMDPSLADSMTDRELDEMIINKEYNRILEYYEGIDEDGTEQAKAWRNSAMKLIADE